MEPPALGQALGSMWNKSNRMPSALGLVLLACGGQALDVGANHHGSGGTDTVDAGDPGAVGGAPGSVGGKQREPSWPDPTSCTSSEGASIASGTWNGYVQGKGDDFDFTLELHGSSEQPCGTLTFGEPQALLPASDPRSEYRPGGGDYHQVFRAPGFAYTVLSARLDGTRLRFRISFAEPYASWCELQTPYYVDETRDFACAPNIALEETSAGCVGSYMGRELVFSCYQFELCSSGAACLCDADGCIAKPEADGSMFDLELDGDQASGVVSGALNESSRTLLSRQ